MTCTNMPTIVVLCVYDAGLHYYTIIVTMEIKYKRFYLHASRYNDVNNNSKKTKEFRIKLSTQALFFFLYIRTGHDNQILRTYIELYTLLLIKIN